MNAQALPPARRIGLTIMFGAMCGRLVRQGEVPSLKPRVKVNLIYMLEFKPRFKHISHTNNTVPTCRLGLAIVFGAMYGRLVRGGPQPRGGPKQKASGPAAAARRSPRVSNAGAPPSARMGPHGHAHVAVPMGPLEKP